MGLENKWILTKVTQLQGWTVLKRILNCQYPENFLGTS